MLKYLQRLGKSLMLPVAVLPVASLMLGLGYYIDPAGWGANSQIAAFLIKTGAAVLDNIPILFAIGVAVGLSKDRDGAVALASLVGFLIVTTLLSPATLTQITGQTEIPAAFGKISNAFTGILIGVITAEIYNKFANTELPTWLAFFSGRRFVPILTSVVMLLVSGILYFVWPFIFGLLTNLGISIVSLGSIGAGIYGFLNRLLIPVGLHHTLNQIFWFNLIGINDIGRFWGDPALAYQGLPTLLNTYKVGMYQAGYFPVMMFGLPGAAFAMYATSKKKNKKIVLSLMLAAALTSFVTGVTEPLEFSFMFLAPALYVVHAVLTAISMTVVAMIGTTAGFGFSAGLIDYVLSLNNPNASNPLLLIPIGLAFFAIYFGVFYVLIKLFDFKTPGRGEEDLEETVVVVEEKGNSKYATQAAIILEAVGGKENILTADNCTTRLRLEVKDVSKVDKQKVKKSGAVDTLILGDNAVQVIIGTKVQFVADEFKKIIK